MSKSKISKDIIVAQALVLFRQKTYHNTSIQDIADACGVFKGSLYHYFDSKEEIMKAVLISVLDYYRNHIAVIVHQKDLSLSNRLELYFTEVSKLFYNEKTNKLYGNIGIESAMTTEDFTPYLKMFFTEFISSIQSLYLEKYEPHIAQELAERAVCELEGAMMLSRVYNQVDFIKNSVKRLKNRL
ncbi:MAG: TetR/AcrR family transcriptional regulator [Chitinophagales bacterium]|jgi:TetR/AcrR family transcriptional repressor of nem operon|nr:TetR/AcrR family transcriptional regulator [Chitinophagales bacterium]